MYSIKNSVIAVLAAMAVLGETKLAKGQTLVGIPPHSMGTDNPLQNCTVHKSPLAISTPIALGGQNYYVTELTTPIHITAEQSMFLYNGGNNSVILQCDSESASYPYPAPWQFSYNIPYYNGFAAKISPELPIYCTLNKVPDQTFHQNASVRMFATNYTATEDAIGNDEILNVGIDNPVSFAYKSNQTSVMSFAAVADNDDGSRLGAGATVFLSCSQGTSKPKQEIQAAL